VKSVKSVAFLFLRTGNGGTGQGHAVLFLL
jgi:hypothetical protein